MAKVDICSTRKDFIAEVPWGDGDRRLVIVENCHHGGREYTHLHTWNRHRVHDCWYPTKRYFTIPRHNIRLLVDALAAALGGHTADKPEWLAYFESQMAWRAEVKAMDLLNKVNAPA